MGHTAHIQVFSQSVSQGNMLTINEVIISSIRKFVNIANNTIGSSMEISFTVIAQSGAGSEVALWNNIAFNTIGDTYTYIGTSSSFSMDWDHTITSGFNSMMIRVEVLSSVQDQLPNPAYIDINFSNFP